MSKFITSIIILFSTNVFAQNNDKQMGYENFYQSFSSSFKYPTQLSDRCIPTFTLMLVQFSTKGTVESIKFSDGAFPQFVDEIKRVQNNIDFYSVYKDIIKAKKDNKTVLIPIHIDSEQIGGCKSIIIANDIKNLFQFGGKPIVGNYYIYPEVYIKNLVGRANY
ncbi:hypothetical protein ACR78F_06135 [Sphingobacterium spiritivorum]|uniref:hypothetical protein n=1 Tax=Sphingobacterium spiritivorum TaxID=258 RepID=UPI003DA4E147